AVFWGLNFTAIYPILKIIGSDKNLQAWVRESIAKIEQQIGHFEDHIDELKNEKEKLEKKPPSRWVDQQRRNLANGLAGFESKLETSRKELYRYEVAKKYIDLLFPRDRFQTLALVIILVVLAVALKGFFEFGQETLVGSVVNRSLFDVRNRFYRNTIH